MNIVGSNMESKGCKFIVRDKLNILLSPRVVIRLFLITYVVIFAGVLFAQGKVRTSP